MTIFHNPVHVRWGSSELDGIDELIAGRRAVLITTPGMERRGAVARLRERIGGDRLAAITRAQPNPTVQSIQTNAAELAESGVAEVIVALGGGSALDSAKGVAAIMSPGASGTWFSRHLRNAAPFPDDFSPPPIIAIPTTAGTGSEVTKWGTVWDDASGVKHSISHHLLFPECALLVTELTVTASRELTLVTALDALSHCMESIWNRNANPVSDAFAIAGIERIMKNLDHVLLRPGDIEVRRELQTGALLGGFALSVTATALAHSISYPLTSQLGMPHGLACGFTLPELMRFNGEVAPMRVALIAGLIGAKDHETGSRELRRCFGRWGVSDQVNRYADRGKVTKLKDRLITPGRAENNVRQASPDDALEIVLRSLH